MGYELEGVEDGTGIEKEGMGNVRFKIMYLLEEGLVETEKMMDRDPD